MYRLLPLILCAVQLLIALGAMAAPMTREALEALVIPPFKLGEQVNDKGVYTILNSGGADAGFVFETQPLAPLPGFSGAPINILVTLDLEANILDAQLIDHNEPIFVSGLGQAPFHKFFEQYKGHSIATTMVVGVPYGDKGASSSLVYLDGVTKATASVRIAHESLMGAALSVAREKMQGVRTGPPALAIETGEDLTWADLVDQGIAKNQRVTNAELQQAFAGTLWEDDDPIAADAPEGVFLDLWIIDIGPPAIARAALSKDTYAELSRFLEISDNDEPLLVIEAGRHGLVTEDFIRNTSPDLLSMTQGGFPVALRDADLIVETHADAPEGVAMILRTDKRLGFDPMADWTLDVLTTRAHGVFMPQIGETKFSLTHKTPERFFERPNVQTPAPPWLEALYNRQTDLIILAVAAVLLVAVLALAQNQLASLPAFTPLRLGVLAAMTVFVGWWGQGQLSIVTPLAVMRAAIDSGSYAFLLYDPFSLVVWAVAIGGFIWWGRGLFCGWLCPFGALQEITGKIGQWLRLPQIRPSDRWDARLRSLKYVILAGMIAIVLYDPAQVDLVAEVEPFKTAITVQFDREWWFVAYAVFWLALSMVLFKGFCRYVCPLGAVMAIGGLLRRRDWIERRVECGSPCQLCKVKCQYGAIKQTGEIRYDECFQCLDCVTIHDDAKQCVPLVLAAKGRSLRAPA